MDDRIVYERPGKRWLLMDKVALLQQLGAPATLENANAYTCDRNVSGPFGVRP